MRSASSLSLSAASVYWSVLRRNGLLSPYAATLRCVARIDLVRFPPHAHAPTVRYCERGARPIVPVRRRALLVEELPARTLG